MAQRRAQIVRDRIGKGFQFRVRSLQLRSAFHHPHFQSLVQFFDLPLRCSALGDVAKRYDASAGIALIVSHGPAREFEKHAGAGAGTPNEEFRLYRFSANGAQQGETIHREGRDFVR